MLPLRPALLAVAVTVVAMFAEHAWSQEEAREEFWPELDLYNRFDSQWRLFSLVGLSHAREVQYADVQVGTHIEYSMLPLDPLLGAVSADFERYRLLQFRLGYRYAQAFAENAHQYKENRIVTEASLRLAITEKILASDRNAVDFRWILGEYSWRYRNRARLERQFVTDFALLNPHVSVEAFYDSRYSSVSRIAYSLGVEWKLSAEAVLEFSYARHNSTHSSTPHVNGFGLTLSLYY